jgi:hypothetical protein
LVLAAAKDALTTKVDGEYLENIELMIDHYARIRLVIPLKVDDRRRITAPQSWWKRYHKMMRSGVWDGTEPIYKYNWMTSGSSTKSPWSNADIIRLNDICLEIERSATINPNSLRMPRGPVLSPGQPAAPWLFNPAHMYSDHGWQYLACLSTAERCDWVNDHSRECAETLFLVCVVMWYQRDGGKDKVLGRRMTIFKHHPFRFLIGRALHGASGSIMVTGWQTKHPVSLSQYSDQKRTITMESCRGKSNFPTEDETVAAWTL